MNTYRIPHTDLKASRLAYGCMNIGGRWGAASMTKDERKAAIDAVAAAFEHGINFFDHADIYMQGRSEEVFAEAIAALKVPRKDMIIQSKCGIRFGDDPNPGDPGRYDFSYEHITRSAEGILRRLRIDTLDILLLHRPDALMEPQEVARAFDALQRSGKVRHFGVSNFTGPQIAYLQAALDQPLVVNQVELSLLHHYLINDGVAANTKNLPSAGAAGTLDYCQRRDILIQAWSPVAGGALFNPPADAPDNVRRCAESDSPAGAGKGHLAGGHRAGLAAAPSRADPAGNRHHQAGPHRRQRAGRRSRAEPRGVVPAVHRRARRAAALMAPSVARSGDRPQRVLWRGPL